MTLQDAASPPPDGAAGLPAGDLAPDGPAASAEAAASDAEARLDRTLKAAEIERLRVTARAVSAALVAIGVVVTALTGLPDAVYYYGLISLFAVSLWSQYYLARWRDGGGVWQDWLFIACNFALMAFTLAWPNPLSILSDYAHAGPVMLRFGNFVYFFVLLAALAFSFSPALVLWGGVCGAAAWSALRLAVAMQPGVTLSLPDGLGLAEEIEATLRPEYMDPGVWLQEVAALLIVAGLLALVVRGSRRLVLEQAALARRSANLARYVPAPVAEALAAADAPFFVDRAPMAAVLFTDIVGFTGWAESRSPAEVMALLREVHGFVGEEVFRAGGVLDKFIGDGAMATFGVAAAAAAAAPGGSGEDGAGSDAAARAALACAEALMARAAAVNALRTARGLAPARLSVGVHFGPVLVGDVGGAGRLELSVVGDTVNVASRLEALTRPLGAGAAASDEAMQAAGGPRPGWRDRGRRVLPGRHGAVTVWTLEHAADDPARPAEAAEPAG